MIPAAFAASELLNPQSVLSPKSLLRLVADSFSFPSLREPKIILYHDLPHLNAKADSKPHVHPIMAIVFFNSDINISSSKLIYFA